jgi:hypothetical protein
VAPGCPKAGAPWPTAVRIFRIWNAWQVTGEGVLQLMICLKSFFFKKKKIANQYLYQCGSVPLYSNKVVAQNFQPEH